MDVGGMVGVAEAELEDLGAVLQVAVCPDVVGGVVVEDVEEGPAGAEGEVHGALFHERCGCFLSEGDAEAGVSKGLEMVEGNFSARMAGMVLIGVGMGTPEICGLS
jgi:hypothetical protein